MREAQCRAFVAFLLVSYAWLSGPSKAECGAQEVNDSHSETTNIIHQIEHAQTPFELGASYRSLFKEADDEKLLELTNHRLVGVAIQAAWERARRATVASTTSVSDSNRKKLEQFLGIVKRRLKIPIPPWWERTVREVVGTNTNDLVFPVSANRRYQKTPVGVSAPAGVTIEDRGQRIAIRADTDEITLPKSSFDNRCIEPGICAIVRPNVSFVAIHSGVRSPFSMIKLGGKSHELFHIAVWTGPIVFHSGIVLPGQRLGDHVVSIHTTNDGVLVCGAERYSVYLEAFSENGENIFRFSSSY